jgi:hypothetical protein
MASNDIMIKINPTYLDTKFPGLSAAQRGRFLFPLEDASGNGMNVPVVPDPRNVKTVNGWQPSSFQSITRTLMINLDGVLMDKTMMKTASSGVGYNYTNALAMAVANGVLLVYDVASGTSLDYTAIMAL